MVESHLENNITSTNDENGVSEVTPEIPFNDYCLIGWDLDTTGRKLLDEICHIAAYTPDQTFSLYIMPHGDLNNGAKKRHMIRIVTVDFYRIIKDITNNKMLKTKSEVSALTDFLEWLETVCKKQEKCGVLLICHESYKFNPHLLIKSLLKYNLLERFSNVVKGFVDCHTFAKKKCEQTMVSFTLRILSKVLLDKDNVEIYKASDRAHLAYDIVQHLCAGESEIGNGALSPNLVLVRTLLPFVTSVQHEVKVLQELQIVLRRQHTLKPIFAQFLGFKTTTYHERRNALQLRKYLVDAFVDYDMLKAAWIKGKEALEELINDKLNCDEISTTSKEELLKLIIEHFQNTDEFKRKSRDSKTNIEKLTINNKNEPKLSESSDKSESKPCESDNGQLSVGNENGVNELVSSVQNQLIIDVKN